MNKRWLTRLLWLVPLGFLAVFFFYPLGKIFSVSFSRAEAGMGAVVAEAWRSEVIRRVVAFTFWQAGLSTLLTLLVGLPGAYLFGRFTFRGKKLLRALTGIPFVMPTLVVAAAFESLLGDRGWINQGLMRLFDLQSPPVEFSYTLAAILIAHVFYNTTIVMRLVGDFWARLDPKLAGAARILGASPLRAWLKVTLPLLMPAILAASLLVFIFDFTSFGVILILGGPRFSTIETEIYFQAVSLFNLPIAAVLASLQLVTTLALTAIYTRLVSRTSRPLKAGCGENRQQRLRSWQGRLVAGVLIVLMVVFFLSPLVSLGLRSVVQVGSARSGEGLVLTGEFYRALWQEERQTMFTAAPGEALLTSLGNAGTTVLLAVGLGFPAAWMLARHSKDFFSRLLDPLLMLPIGTSAVTLGLGFIVALNQPPLDLRTSPALIPLAHSLVALPFVVRSLTPSLRAIQPQLRQAASVLGASPGQVLRHIDFPLVGRALIGSAVFAFTISLGEFGATALVGRPDRPTITMMIYRFISSPGVLNYGQALALSTILMVVTAAGMLVIEQVRVGEGAEF
jgi:thiamine transport system permease protein